MKYEKLKNRWYYRLVKVVYIICITVLLILSISLSLENKPRTHTVQLGSIYYNIACNSVNYIEYVKTDNGRSGVCLEGSWNRVFIDLFVSLLVILVSSLIIRFIFLYVVTGEKCTIDIKKIKKNNKV